MGNRGQGDIGLRKRMKLQKEKQAEGRRGTLTGEKVREEIRKKGKWERV